MQNKGWVKLWREQFTHEVSERKPWCDGYAWSYLYSQANYKPGVTNFRNQYIPIERGQFITSKLKLEKIFGWSERRINSFLTSLETREMCAIRVTKRFIMVTICNYEKYQSNQDENEGTDVGTGVGTDKEQVRTIKEVKELKKIGRSQKQNDPRIKKFFSYWGETFSTETGQPYVFSYGKEGSLVKQLLQVHSLETLQDMTRAFFRDEQCKRRGLTIGIFFQEINRLFSLKSMNPLEEARRELGVTR